jgi:hypothetical protein
MGFPATWGEAVGAQRATTGNARWEAAAAQSAQALEGQLPSDQLFHGVVKVASVVFIGVKVVAGFVFVRVEVVTGVEVVDVEDVASIKLVSVIEVSLLDELVVEDVTSGYSAGILIVVLGREVSSLCCAWDKDTDVGGNTAGCKEGCSQNAEECRWAHDSAIIVSNDDRQLAMSKAYLNRL